MSASSSACFPLTGTTTCTMFSDVKVHPFANVFRDVPSFDKYIRDSFPTSPVYMNYFQQNYTCPSWDGTGLRFPVSFICGLIVDVSTTQFNCNEPAQVKNICKSTALQTLSSYRSAFSNPELCTPGGQRAIPQRYLSFVNGLAVDTPGSGSCFPGMAQEIRNCGMFLYSSAESTAKELIENVHQAL